jgi:hypothetical protein
MLVRPCRLPLDLDTSLGQPLIFGRLSALGVAWTIQHQQPKVARTSCVYNSDQIYQIHATQTL